MCDLVGRVGRSIRDFAAGKYDEVRLSGLKEMIESSFRRAGLPENAPPEVNPLAVYIWIIKAPEPAPVQFAQRVLPIETSRRGVTLCHDHTNVSRLSPEWVGEVLKDEVTRNVWHSYRTGRVTGR